VCKICYARAIVQAVTGRPLTLEAWVRSQVSRCGIFGGQSGIGTGFSFSTSVFPCQFHSSGDQLHGKMKKKKLILFITGLHNKPQGRGATVASAAGPFTTKKNSYMGWGNLPFVVITKSCACHTLCPQVNFSITRFHNTVVTSLWTFCEGFSW
jgi:hypothetical protein